MAVKGSRTTSDYIPWDEMNLLLRKLEHDKRFMLLTLIAVGSYTGLRISDILRLTWKSFNGNYIELREYKTKKYRRIKIHKALRRVIERIKSCIQPECDNPIIFNRKRNKVFSIQYINRRLKEIKEEYSLLLSNFSTHSFRKTFGRRVWSQAGYSEKSLILLSFVFNHSDTKVTRRYLGITDEEIEAVYDTL
jgi:integrase